MVDANVAAVQADVAQMKTIIATVASFVASLLAEQAKAIVDDEDLAAIKAAHVDMAAANVSLRRDRGSPGRRGAGGSGRSPGGGAPGSLNAG